MLKKRIKLLVIVLVLVTGSFSSLASNKKELTLKDIAQQLLNYNEQTLKNKKTVDTATKKVKLPDRTIKNEKIFYLKLKDSINKNIKKYSIDELDQVTFINKIASIEAEKSPDLKLNDEKLAGIMLSLYKFDNYRFSEYVRIDLWNDYLKNKHIDELMKPLIAEIKNYPLGMINVFLTPESREKYQEFINVKLQELKNERSKLKENNRELNKNLYDSARLGDNDSLNKLIKNYKNMVRSDSDFRNINGLLIKIGNRQTIEAVLSRFKENHGAPEYYTGESIRCIILQDLYAKFPTEKPFCNYPSYLDYKRNADTASQILDDHIGGEAGVKKLYQELSQWAKKKFDIDVDFSGADYKIKTKTRIKYIF